MEKILKKNQEITSKESDIELLTRLVVEGFLRVDDRFEQVDKQFEQVGKQFEQVGKQFEQVGKQFELINSQLFSINHQLKNHEERLERIERKQTGFLANLDESVHRSEFKTLIKRVEVLEDRK